MTFTVQDFHDLITLLERHPDWRADLRRLVLTDELLALPELVRELTAAQQRTEQRLEELAAAVERLAEAQQRTEQRLEELAEGQRALQYALSDLTKAEERTATRVGDIMGDLLELRYREHVGGYFGLWLRRAQAVKPESLDDTLEESLSFDELRDVLRLDLLVRGRLREHAGSPEVWLAVEVAYVLNEADVARADRRAGLLRRAGLRAVPLVAGERIVQEAEEAARLQKVAVMLDGSSDGWEESFAAWENDQA